MLATRGSNSFKKSLRSIHKLPYHAFSQLHFVHTVGSRGEEVGISKLPIFYEWDRTPPELNIYYYWYSRRFPDPEWTTKARCDRYESKGERGKKLWLNARSTREGNWNRNSKKTSAMRCGCQLDAFATTWKPTNLNKHVWKMWAEIQWKRKVGNWNRNFWTHLLLKS